MARITRDDDRQPSAPAHGAGQATGDQPEHTHNTSHGNALIACRSVHYQSTYDTSDTEISGSRDCYLRLCVRHDVCDLHRYLLGRLSPVPAQDGAYGWSCRTQRAELNDLSAPQSGRPNLHGHAEAACGSGSCQRNDGIMITPCDGPLCRLLDRFPPGCSQGLAARVFTSATMSTRGHCRRQTLRGVSAAAWRRPGNGCQVPVPGRPGKRRGSMRNR
jgi:hypothetical protein